MIVTATVAPAPAEGVGNAVTIITHEELEQIGVQSVIDALRLVPGLDARARGPRDVQTDFSIRGATFGQNLVLADGMRINDSQSAHHDGEIPVPLIGVDRIEVVAGAGSAVHGADALGGTINVISRRGTFAEAAASTGQHGYFDGQAVASGGALPAGWTVSGWGSRSDGFMADREFALGGAGVRGTLGHGWTLDLRHQRRGFGANGFYGPSPSKEWTDQTLGSLGWRHQGRTWTVTAHGLVRDHGDHFRWDINRPGFAENRHRTHATEAGVQIGRPFRTATFTFGGSTGGDWIRSSNLGRHAYGRASAFAELRAPLDVRTTLTTGLRVDAYSSFGSAVSPSVAVATRLGSRLRARASAGHAFRIPSFTELYYRDPSNIGRADLQPERGWSVDGGLDWTAHGWTGAVDVFHRWDRNVIDWVRATADERWQATNVRDVGTDGVEASLTRHWNGAWLRAYVAGLKVGAPSLDLLSKYVLEYVRRQTGVSVAVPVAGGVRAAVNVDHRLRFDGQSYALVSAHVTRAVGRTEVYVDGTNLLDEHYREIAGVDMPGRWLTVGVTIR